MKKVIVLLTYDSLSKGGTSVILYQIANYLSSKGFNVHVLFIKPKLYGDWESDKPENLQLHYGKYSKLRMYLYLLKQLFKFRKYEFEYSFSSLLYQTALIGLYKRIGILKVKHAIGRESTSTFERFTGFKLFYKKIMYHMGYPALETLICQTDYMRSQLLDNLSWIEKRTRVCVIPNPIDLRKIKQMEKVDLDTKLMQPYIVSAGRMITEKGFDILITAFQKLVETESDLKLVILGDGKLKNMLEEQIKTLGLTGKIILTGTVKNVYPYFKHAKMCVVSSRIEGFPNVLLQMMSQNEKVVSTLCAGDIEKIKGLFTCAPNQVDALSNTMKECLKSDTSSYRRMFDLELQSRSIDTFVSKVLYNKNSKSYN